LPGAGCLEAFLPLPFDVRSHRAWLIIVAAVVIAAGGFLGWRHFHAASDKAAADKTAAARAAPIPVTVGTVEKADFPVYLRGLGTVQPYQTVTVRSRVDGEVIKIAFKQGQMVKEGDILAQIDPRPYQAALDQAIAKQKQDQADLRNAQANLARYGALAKEDFASRQQLDTQQAAFDRLTAQVKGDQGAIDNAQTQVTYTTIRAPLSGKTGFRLIDQGNNVHASDTNGIVTIVQLQPISVVLTAPEEQVPEINDALAKGTVAVIALSSDGAKTLAQGRLALVNNEVDQASGTIRMKATFDNKDNVLWPGLSVSTLLLVNTLKQVVVIPRDAAQHGPNGLYVFVVGDGNKAEKHDIKAGQEGNGKLVVLQGLSPGQKVVISGQYRLQQGTVVQPDETAQAPTQTAQPTDGAPVVPGAEETAQSPSAKAP
jgi:membrane fusion protein, multidrug efflux system